MAEPEPGDRLGRGACVTSFSAFCSRTRCIEVGADARMNTYTYRELALVQHVFQRGMLGFGHPASHGDVYGG